MVFARPVVNGGAVGLIPNISGDPDLSKADLITGTQWDALSPRPLLIDSSILCWYKDTKANLQHLRQVYRCFSDSRLEALVRPPREVALRKFNEVAYESFRSAIGGTLWAALVGTHIFVATYSNSLNSAFPGGDWIRKWLFVALSSCVTYQIVKAGTVAVLSLHFALKQWRDSDPAHSAARELIREARRKHPKGLAREEYLANRQKQLYNQMMGVETCLKGFVNDVYRTGWEEL